MRLEYVGNPAVQMVGREEWDRSTWELDTLRIKMRGSAPNVDTYLAGLIQWTAYGGDGNMYLSNWSTDDNPVFPTVTLRYIGKKSGVLPDVQHITGNQVQTVRQDQVNPVFDMLYLSPVTTLVSISRGTPEEIPASFPNLAKMQVLFIRGSSVTGAVQLLPNINPGFWWLAYFIPVQYTNPSSEELVPNQYYRNQMVTGVTLFPLIYQ